MHTQSTSIIINSLNPCLSAHLVVAILFKHGQYLRTLGSIVVWPMQRTNVQVKHFGSISIHNNNLGSVLYHFFFISRLSVFISDKKCEQVLGTWCVNRMRLQRNMHRRSDGAYSRSQFDIDRWKTKEDAMLCLLLFIIRRLMINQWSIPWNWVDLAP